MINQDRLRLMTRLAAYEEHEGKKCMAIADFFRGDYIGWNIIKTIVSATIAFIIIIGMALYYDMEVLMQDIYKMDLMGFGKQILIYYLVFIAIYAVIAYIVYSVRYYRAKKSLKKYFNRLKQLAALYSVDGKGKRISDEDL